MRIEEQAIDLADLTMFEAAAGLRHVSSCEADGEPYPLALLGEGFLALTARGFDHDLPILLGALGWGRPVALLDDRFELGRFAAAATGSRYLPAADAGFVVPDAFRHRRARAVEERLARCEPAGSGPVQRIAAVGVGPWTEPDDPRTAAALATATDVVMSDHTYTNTFPRLPLAGSMTPHALPYQYVDFEANLTMVDAALRGLQRKGVSDVALLIEGNPETYDVLDGMSLQRRDLSITAGVPIGLLAAKEVAPRFERDPLREAFIYLSGLNSRHRASAEQFLGELTCYLAAGVTCVLVEMFRGDVHLAVRAMELAGGSRTAVLLSNIFTAEASATYLSTPSADAARTAENATRGRLTTMLITNEQLR